MDIRILRPQELQEALDVCWRVFEQEIAPSYTEEGVNAFRNFIDHSSMMERYERKEMIFFGIFDKNNIKGTLAVRMDGHISLFFVEKEYQGKGFGTVLFQTAYNFCVQNLKVEKITVNATPQSVAKYIHMGMKQTGNMEEKEGIRSVPMEMPATPAMVRPVKLKSGKTGMVAAIAIAMVVAFIGLISFMGYRLIEGMYEADKQRSTVSEEETSGVEGISEFISEDLSYEIKEELYDFTDDEKINTVIDFYVMYPQLEGLDEEVQSKINQTIEDCAMETVEEIYFNPSEEIKETVLQSDVPALVSYVTYKVTYADDDFVSIILEDQSYKGNEAAYEFDFRTLNINLNSGEVYEVKDIVKIDQTFAREWLEIMREEVANKQFLMELSEEEIVRTLKGDSMDGIYEVNFFVTAKGVEIGYSFDYPEDDANDYGYAWVTAPFTFEEIEKYSVESLFWNEMN